VFKSNDAYASFSVDDQEAARTFYGGTLGLEVSDTSMDALFVTLGNGARLLVYSKPNHVPATFTVLNFVVDDLERTVDDLIAAGVPMEHYDMLGFKTDEKGILRGEGGAPDIAWFTDPAGNIIAAVRRA
jgi:catechol 2,3-dioxygenase-like lactoylglutathione lyase family enzyme